MTEGTLLMLVVVFVTAAVVAAGLMLLLSRRLERKRLQQMIDPAAHSAGQSGWVEKAARVAKPISRLSLPEEGWEKSGLRTRFVVAGWRNPAVATLFFSAKTVLALLLPATLAAGLNLANRTLPLPQMLLLLLVTSALGYYGPNLVLRRTAERRQREIFLSLPDTLDLLTVCVEAGLSLERALVKVAAEIHLKSMVMAQELQLVLMEMRAGFTKERALRNFALRSGVDDVDALVAMMIQSERFGTSMGESLRVHSDNLRTKRRMVAEEAAAKIGLKLLFPLILCIFPILLMVVLGPAGIQMVRTMPALSQSVK